MNPMNSVPRFRMVLPTLVPTVSSLAVSRHVVKTIDRIKALLSKKSLDSNFNIDMSAAEGEKGKSFVFNLELDTLFDLLEKDRKHDKLFSFSGLIEKNDDVSLFYETQELIGSQKLPYNTEIILKVQPILEYLFCKAVKKYSLKHASSIVNYITDTEGDMPLKPFYEYIGAHAALEMAKENKLETGTYTNFLERITPFFRSTEVSFAASAFDSKVSGVIKGLVFDFDEYQLVATTLARLNVSATDVEINALIAYLKQSKIKIDNSNAEHFLAIALNEIKNGELNIIQGDGAELSSADYSVTYYDDTAATLEIVRENILCAAQLYYVMVLGDELELFNVVDQIVTKHLMSGHVDIRSRELMDDLQAYTFNDSFRDLKNGVVYKRTNPEERRMFYRQVFSMGHAEVMEGMNLNTGFETLWRQLLVETVSFIDKVGQSENPQYFVSRQNISQAIEDLQYNLSTHCSGMAKVASPVISKELDFVVERFLKNPELVKQLALSNSSSFWKVVERVVGDLRGAMPNVSALRSKAIYGHSIISTIAESTPTFVSDDKRFFEFISTVEAYIIANSQLEEEPPRTFHGNGAGIGAGGGFIPEGIPGVSTDEWNF